MKKKNIKFDSYQDIDAIKLYLQQIIDGLETGTVNISHGDESIKLTPAGLIAMSLSASQGKSSQMLRIKMEWSMDETQKEASEESLSIN